MAGKTAGVVTVEVRGKDVNLTSLLKSIKKESQDAERAMTRSGEQAAAGAQKGAAGFLRLQSAVAATEAATAKAASANRNYVQAQEGYRNAITRLESALGAQNQTTTQTLAVERQLITLRGQAAKAAQAEADALDRLAKHKPAPLPVEETNKYAAALGGLKSVLGAVGIAVGAKQILDFGVDAAKSALNLQQVQGQLKQIAGSTEVYNKILATAKQQQVLFGGSLADNLSQLSSFAVAARTTGASLDQLIRTAQRLATLDPEQGIGGAKLALNEALSGNASSLNKRFEIPKAALDGLSDASTTAAQKLEIVNKYLDDAGISANGAADSVTKDAQAYNSLAAALDAVKNKIGAGIAKSFAPAADQVATSLGQQDAATQAAQTAQTFAAYKQQLAEIDAAQQKVFGSDVLGVFLARITTGYTALTEKQFGYVQALVQQGVAQDQAVAKVQQYGRELFAIDQVQSKLQQSGSLSATAIADLTAKMQGLATSGAGGAQNIANLISLLSLGQINATQFAAGIDGLVVMQQRQAQATAEQASIEANYQSVQQVTYGAIIQNTVANEAHAAATDAASVATANYQTQLQAEAAQSLISGANTEILSLAKQQLQQQAQATANSIVAAGGDIVGQAARLAGSSSQVDVLTAAYIRLAQAKAQAANEKAATAAFQDYRAGERSGGSVKNAKQEVYAQQQRGIVADAVALRKQSQELDKKINAVIGSPGKSGGKGGGAGGATKLNDQQKLNNQLLGQQDRYENKAEESALEHQRKLEEIEQEHADKVLDIQKKAQEKQAAQAKHNEIDKRANEIDVLTNLTGSSLNDSKDLKKSEVAARQQELTRINAQYYADRAAAQESAQRGDVELSERQLALASERANKELQYAEAIADARAKGDKDEVARQQGLLAKERDLLAEQQTQLGPDAIKAEQSKDLAAEAARASAAQAQETSRNTQALDKLSRALENGNAATLAGAARSGKAVNADGTPIAGGVPSSVPAPLAAPAAAQTANDKPIATEDGQAKTTDAATSGLADVVSAINGMKDAIVAAERNVERAVKNIKLTAPGGMQ